MVMDTCATLAHPDLHCLHAPSGSLDIALLAGTKARPSHRGPRDRAAAIHSGGPALLRSGLARASFRHVRAREAFFEIEGRTPFHDLSQLPVAEPERLELRLEPMRREEARKTALLPEEAPAGHRGEAREAKAGQVRQWYRHASPAGAPGVLACVPPDSNGIAVDDVEDLTAGRRALDRRHEAVRTVLDVGQRQARKRADHHVTGPDDWSIPAIAARPTPQMKPGRRTVTSHPLLLATSDTMRSCHRLAMS